ncbi:YicC family protein [Alginatibacterium sediminis]|uniref:YicC family protein n=1 Tax=Alginatibacterium sediminis TaxID=2164068 RepID=A0A420EN68_9ALTE|nr:YicC/YloC family endoribonuclease [Alginatibacterium sediminis]RKF22130.1 YicC family protein [Alginatibacterium sediminis]
MIQSMTGYARVQVKHAWGTATWEIRSVNQRYLESYWRMPEQFRGLEPILREKLRKKIQRGKVECNLRFEAGNDVQTNLQLNESFAAQILHSAKWVQEQAGGQINPVDILNWPGVMQAPEQDVEGLNADLLKAWEQALSEFVASRQSEGEKLHELVEARLAGIFDQVAIVRTRMPEILDWQRERLTTRLQEALAELDPARVEQEMVMLAQKSDVAEELDRLDGHVAESRKILKKGGAIGRRLDFMMQEFNREANTLGSKSIHADITQAAVELKVLIEQMREQIQNME